jgi:hypothetical protein
LDIIRKAIRRENKPKNQYYKAKFNPLDFLNQLLDEILQKNLKIIDNQVIIKL